jgi:hypothetical protein
MLNTHHKLNIILLLLFEHFISFSLYINLSHSSFFITPYRHRQQVSQRRTTAQFTRNIVTRYPSSDRLHLFFAFLSLDFASDSVGLRASLLTRHFITTSPFAMRDTMRTGQPLTRATSSRKMSSSIHQRSSSAPNPSSSLPPSMQRSASSVDATFAAQAAARRLGLAVPAPVAESGRYRPAIRAVRRIPVTLRTVEETPEKFVGSVGSVCSSDDVGIRPCEFQDERTQRRPGSEQCGSPTGSVLKIKEFVKGLWTEIKAMWKMGPPDFHLSLLPTNHKTQAANMPDPKMPHPLQGITINKLVGDMSPVKHPSSVTPQNKCIVLSPSAHYLVDSCSFVPPQFPSHRALQPSRRDSLTTQVTQWSDVVPRLDFRGRELPKQGPLKVDKQGMLLRLTQPHFFLFL